MAEESDISNLHMRVWSFTWVHCWQANFQVPIPNPNFLTKREMTELCYLSIWYQAVRLSTHFQECTAPQHWCKMSLPTTATDLAQHHWKWASQLSQNNLMSLFWRIQGSSSAEQYYYNKSQQCWPIHQRNTCQKFSEQFQILQVIWGNIWCNESRRINGSSISEGGHSDLP